MPPRTAGSHSSFSIGGGSGMQARGNGLAGNASAVSCMSSIVCCAAQPIPVSCPSRAAQHRCRTVSDVYQDLFNEGSYSGKGIYEIDVFESALAGQIPESAVLSHDLLEGIFARAGLDTDIEVVEEFPSRYSVAAARQHRWVRGDWQLLPWIFGFGRMTRGGTARTAIPLMGRWKLLDNLRRSLSAPAALLALLIAWLQPVPVAAIWTVFIIMTIALPPLIPAIAGVAPRRADASLRNYWRRQ